MLIPDRLAQDTQEISDVNEQLSQLHFYNHTGYPITPVIGKEFSNMQDIEFSESLYTIVLENNSDHVEYVKEITSEEINGLYDREVFSVIKRSNFKKEDIRNMTVIKANLILSIKEPGTDSER